MNATTVITSLKVLATPERAEANAWFFQTGKGQYGYGDRFLGVTVPQQRKVAKEFKNLALLEVEKLVMSRWHEVRLTGVFILVGQYKEGDAQTKQRIYDFYMSHTSNINNWDLVDSSADRIVGAHLQDNPKRHAILSRLAASKLLWERRIAIISTFWYIKQGKADDAWTVAELLLHDEHDLIQKAVGWMLREIGKRVDHDLLLRFLDLHAATMPRTTLRYAIEHLNKTQKQHYMQLKNAD